ncbi:MAG: CHAT domain-containing protein [Cyanobacteria bacterium SBLK]|nr:CHAT domain-containing protein [Cyanobacteria bacterium SBLK]
MPEEQRSLDSTARQLYEKGRYDEAIQLLQQTRQQARDRGDTLGEVAAGRNLALIYGKVGDIPAARNALEQSRNLLESLRPTGNRDNLLAQILEVEGQLHLSTGQAERAWENWQAAAKIYRQQDDTMGNARSQIGQTQALQAMGLHEQASKRLHALKQQLDEQEDTLVKVKALQILGDVQRSLGRLQEARANLEASLAIAKARGDRENMASIQISLGNTARFAAEEQERDTALERARSHYRQAALNAPNLELQIQAQLNEFRVAIEREDMFEAKALLPQIQTNITQLPATRPAIYAQINLAKNLLKLDETEISPGQIARILARALEGAQDSGDRLAEAQVWGALGELYETHQRYVEAQTATEKGLLLAQSLNAPEIIYREQWQLGRILRERARREDAIAAYDRAVSTLQSLRGDLVAINPDLQFSFRESVEPVYREYVDLLLQPDASQNHLVRAREAIEALQLAELDNFFRDACSDVQAKQIDQIDPRSAIFYTIMLSDRLETILALPGKELQQFTSYHPREELEKTLAEMNFYIATPRGRRRNRKRLEVSQQVYNWLIRDLEADLEASGVKNLVFVLDGALRNLPIAALYDPRKQEYLIQKYSVSLAPSLNLIDPQPLAREKLQVLGGGVSEETQNFAPIPNVKKEMERVRAAVGAEILLDNTFIEGQFKALVNENPVTVVHLATHGQFSSNAEDTFILTWDDKLNIEELGALLRSDTKRLTPIELLVLSACETATGDDRAVLGLAGMAVRAGARSTIASLWLAADETTSLMMSRFYEELAKADITKAEALQKAQLEILQGENVEFRHPYFWSGFVLVGNWL